ncbi:MAG: caffeoyl-CoA O-methyltransferase [bacterium]|jgi:caffeoyl-CoA O-methyltransferase
MDFEKSLKYVTPLNVNVPEWMEEIKQTGVETHVPIVRDDMGWLLRFLCMSEKPKRILELGCGISYSTHWMLLGSPDSTIVALDANLDRIELCREFTKKSGYEDSVEYVHVWIADYLKDKTEQFDLIFMDSGKNEYKDLIDICFDRLKLGGLLIVDNILFNGKVFKLEDNDVKKYTKSAKALRSFNEMMSQHAGFDSSFLPFSDGTLLARKISNKK